MQNALLSYTQRVTEYPSAKYDYLQCRGILACYFINTHILIFKPFSVIDYIVHYLLV